VRLGLILYSDFCGFFPSTPNSTISDTEGIEVSWCSKNGHGTRGMPPGTIQGIQVLNNPNYVQIVAFVDQTKINIQAGDFGGELDGWAQDGVRVSSATLCVRIFCLMIHLPSAGQSHWWYGIYQRVQPGQSNPSANLILDRVCHSQRSLGSFADGSIM